MGREYEEKIFADSLDRLLAGEEVRMDASMTDDLRTALDFSGRMGALRAAPSSLFQANLKARLLQKLNEREAAEEARRGWFWGLLHQPLWQAVAAVVLVFIVGGVMWGTGIFSPRGSQMVTAPTPAPMTTTAAPTALPPATSMPAQNMFVLASASTNKASFVQGESVEINVAWRNIASQTVTIEQFPPILSVMQADTGQPVYTFAAGNASATLAPGERTEYVVTWDQIDAKGRKVGPGSYYLELEDFYYEGQAIRNNFTGPVQFEIQPSSSGDLESGRTIYINRSQTVNGLTVTLCRAEIYREGIMLHIYVPSPPDYVLKQENNTLTPTKDYRASAGYSFDGDWVKDAGLSSVEYLGSGMEHTWYIPVPVPPESGEMVFIVNNIGSCTGQWRFDFSLE